MWQYLKPKLVNKRRTFLGKWDIGVMLWGTGEKRGQWEELGSNDMCSYRIQSILFKVAKE